MAQHPTTIWVLEDSTSRPNWCGRCSSAHDTQELCEGISEVLQLHGFLLQMRSHLSGSSKRVAQQKLRDSFAIPRLLLNELSIFLIELVRFLGESVVQVLLVGLLTAIGEHILKPFLEATFKSLLQPLLLFLLKVLGGIRDLTEPLVEVLAKVCSQLAVLLRAIRLVEINLGPDRRTDLRDVGSV